MNIQNYLVNSSISVKNYYFYNDNFCPYNKTKIIINFTIYGSFLSTTQKDNIKNTVNYYALCLYIKKYILKYSCNKKIINSDIKIFIKSFSSLINSGYLTIEILCHTKKVIKIRL